MQVQKLVRTASLGKPLPRRFSSLLSAPSHQLPRHISITPRGRAATTILSIHRTFSSHSISQPMFRNDAQHIESDLREDGHRTWGLVIYRCTYKSDSDWGEFVTRFRSHMINYLKKCNALHMLGGFATTVFDDKSLFDGATTSLVRDNFKEWAKSAPQQEQNAKAGYAVRYVYCIHVDDEALESIVRKPDPPGCFDNTWGFVNLIDAGWEPNDRFDGEEELEEEEEPIEGCTNLDVGWMRVRYDRVVRLTYTNFRDLWSWEDWYCRPPEIARGIITSNAMTYYYGAGEN